MVEKKSVQYGERDKSPLGGGLRGAQVSQSNGNFGRLSGKRKKKVGGVQISCLEAGERVSRFVDEGVTWEEVGLLKGMQGRLLSCYVHTYKEFIPLIIDRHLWEWDHLNIGYSKLWSCLKLSMGTLSSNIKLLSGFRKQNFRKRIGLWNPASEESMRVT